MQLIGLPALTGPPTLSPVEVLPSSLPSPLPDPLPDALAEPAAPSPVDAPPPEQPPPEQPPPPDPVSDAERSRSKLRDPLDAFTPALQHDVAALIAAAFSPVRLRVLLALAPGEPAPVISLARRVGETPDKISGHLRPLRMRDLVHERPQGKEHWYAPDPDRVRFTPHADGGFDLTVLARAGGRVLLTLTVLGESGESPKPEVRMNDESPSPKKTHPSLRHSSFGFLSGFWFRHSDLDVEVRLIHGRGAA